MQCVLDSFLLSLNEVLFRDVLQIIHNRFILLIKSQTREISLDIFVDRGYSDEEEEAEFSSVEDNDEGILYTNNRQHRAMAYNKRDLSYTKVRNRHFHQSLTNY